MGQVKYKLDLLSSSRIHSTFHVSQLKHKVGSKVTTLPTLPLVDDQEVISLEPKKILNHRMTKARKIAKVELLVHWKEKGLTRPHGKSIPS